MSSSGINTFTSLHSIPFVNHSSPSAGSRNLRKTRPSLNVSKLLSRVRTLRTHRTESDPALVPSEPLSVSQTHYTELYPIPLVSERGYPNAHTNTPSASSSYVIPTVQDRLSSGDNTWDHRSYFHHQCSVSGSPTVCDSDSRVYHPADDCDALKHFKKGSDFASDRKLKSITGITKSFQLELGSLLTFIGLFSAVNVAFIIQFQQQNQPEHIEVAIAMLKNLSLQGTPSDQNSTFLPDCSFVPSSNTSTNATNIMWFTSLAICLVTAMSAVVISFGVFMLERTAMLVNHIQESNPRIPALAGPVVAIFQKIVHDKDWTARAVATASGTALVIEIALVISVALFAAGLCIYLVQVSPLVAIVVGSIIGGIILIPAIVFVVVIAANVGFGQNALKEEA